MVARGPSPPTWVNAGTHSGGADTLLPASLTFSPLSEMGTAGLHARCPILLIPSPLPSMEGKAIPSLGVSVFSSTEWN
jgi:hypothetical protein